MDWADIPWAGVTAAIAAAIGLPLALRARKKGAPQRVEQLLHHLQNMGVKASVVAGEIEATWTGDSVKVAAEAPQATTPPPAANLSPETTPPNETTSSPAEPINWPVLWKVIAGVVVVGLITLLLARRRAY